MWTTLLSGLISEGWGFFSKWREEKAKQAEMKLKNETKIVDTTQNIRYEKATSDIKNTSERIAQMAKSWKDEFIMLVFYTPFVTNMISPFLDLYMSLKEGSYQQGMLAKASLESIQSLDAFPWWYVLLVILIALWSWGADKETINKFLDVISFKK